MSTLFLIVNLILRGAFIALGIMICFGSFLPADADPAFKYGVGAVMIAYGAFRLVQLFNEKKKADETEEEEA